MDKIKIRLQKIFKDKNIYIFTLITILFFGIFCIPQFATDTYSVFTSGVRESTLHFLRNGRIITAIFNVLSMKVLKLGYRGTYVFSYILAIMFTIISLYKLNKLIKKRSERRFN